MSDEEGPREDVTYAGDGVQPNAPLSATSELAAGESVGPEDSNIIATENASDALVLSPFETPALADATKLQSYLNDMHTRKRRLSVMMPALTPSINLGDVERSAAKRKPIGRQPPKVVANLSFTEQRLVKMHDEVADQAMQQAALRAVASESQTTVTREQLRLSIDDAISTKDKKGSVYRLVALSPTAQKSRDGGGNPKIRDPQSPSPKLILFESRTSAIGPMSPTFNTRARRLDSVKREAFDGFSESGKDTKTPAVAPAPALSQPCALAETADSFADRPLAVEVMYIARPGMSEDSIPIDTLQKQKTALKVVKLLHLSAQKQLFTLKAEKAAAARKGDTLKLQPVKYTKMARKSVTSSAQYSDVDPSTLSLTAMHAVEIFRNSTKRKEDQGADSDEDEEHLTSDVDHPERKRDDRSHNSAVDALPIGELVAAGPVLPSYADLPPPSPGFPPVSKHVRLLPDGYTLPSQLSQLREDAGRALNFDVDEVYYDDITLNRRYRVRNDAHLAYLLQRHADSLRSGALMHMKIEGLLDILQKGVVCYHQRLFGTAVRAEINWEEQTTFIQRMQEAINEIWTIVGSSFVPDEVHGALLRRCGPWLLLLTVCCIFRFHQPKPTTDEILPSQLISSCLGVFARSAGREPLMTILTSLCCSVQLASTNGDFNKLIGFQAPQVADDDDPTDTAAVDAATRNAPIKVQVTIMFATVLQALVSGLPRPQIAGKPTEAKTAAAPQTKRTMVPQTSPTFSELLVTQFPFDVEQLLILLCCSLSHHQTGRKLLCIEQATILENVASVVPSDAAADLTHVDNVTTLKWLSLVHPEAIKNSWKIAQVPQGLAPAASCVGIMLVYKLLFNATATHAIRPDANPVHAVVPQYIAAALGCIMIEDSARLLSTLLLASEISPSQAAGRESRTWVAVKTARMAGFLDLFDRVVHFLLDACGDKGKLLVCCMLSVAVRMCRHQGITFLLDHYLEATRVGVTLELLTNLCTWVIGKKPSLLLSYDMAAMFQPLTSSVEQESVPAVGSTRLNSWQTSALGIVPYITWGISQYFSESMTLERARTLLACQLSLLELPDPKVKRCAIGAISSMLKHESGKQILLHIPQLEPNAKARAAGTRFASKPLYRDVMHQCWCSMNHLLPTPDEKMHPRNVSGPELALLHSISGFVFNLVRCCPASPSMATATIPLILAVGTPHQNKGQPTHATLQLVTKEELYSSDVVQILSALSWMLLDRSPTGTIVRGSGSPMSNLHDLRADSARNIAATLREFSEVSSLEPSEDINGGYCTVLPLRDATFVQTLYRVTRYPDVQSLSQMLVTMWNFCKRKENQDLLLWGKTLPMLLQWSSALCRHHVTEAMKLADHGPAKCSAIASARATDHSPFTKLTLLGYGLLPDTSGVYKTALSDATHFEEYLFPPLQPVQENEELVEDGPSAGVALHSHVTAALLHELLLSVIQLLLSNINGCFLFANGGVTCPDVEKSIMLAGRRGRLDEMAPLAPRLGVSLPMTQHSSAFVGCNVVESNQVYDFPRLSSALTQCDAYVPGLAYGEGPAHIRDVLAVCGHLAALAVADTSRYHEDAPFYMFDLSRVSLLCVRVLWTAVATDERIQTSMQARIAKLSELSQRALLCCEPVAVVCCRTEVFVSLFRIAGSSLEPLADSTCLEALKLVHVFHSGAASELRFSSGVNTALSSGSRADHAILSAGASKVQSTAMDRTVCDEFISQVEIGYGKCAYEQLLLGYMEATSADSDVNFLLHASALMSMCSCRASRQKLAQRDLDTVSRISHTLSVCSDTHVAANLLLTLLGLSTIAECQIQIAHSCADILIEFCRLGVDEAFMPQRVTGQARMHWDQEAIISVAVTAAKVYRNISRNAINRTTLYKAELAAHVSSFQQEVLSRALTYDEVDRQIAGRDTSKQSAMPHSARTKGSRSTASSSHILAIDEIIHQSQTPSLESVLPAQSASLSRSDLGRSRPASASSHAQRRSAEDTLFYATLSDFQKKSYSQSEAVLANRHGSSPAVSHATAKHRRPSTAVLVPSTSQVTRPQTSNAAGTRTKLGQINASPSDNLPILRTSLQSRMSIPLLQACNKVKDLAIHEGDTSVRPYYQDLDASTTGPIASAGTRWKPSVSKLVVPKDARVSSLHKRKELEDQADEATNLPGQGRRGSLIGGFMNLQTSAGKLKILPGVALDAKGRIPATSTVLRTPRGTVLVVDDGAAGQRDADGVLRPPAIGSASKAVTTVQTTDTTKRPTCDSEELLVDESATENGMLSSRPGTSHSHLHSEPVASISLLYRKDAPFTVQLSTAAAKPSFVTFHADHVDHEPHPITEALQMSPATPVLQRNSLRLPDSILQRTEDEEGNKSEVKLSDSAMQQILTAAVARARGADTSYIAAVSGGAQVALASITAEVSNAGATQRKQLATSKLRLTPVASLLADTDSKDIRAAKFEHTPGSLVCSDMAHYQLADGRSVHLYVKQDLLDADVPSRTKAPMPPTLLHDFTPSGMVPAYLDSILPAELDFPANVDGTLVSLLPSLSNMQRIGDFVDRKYTFRVRFACVPAPLAPLTTVRTNCPWRSFDTRAAHCESKSLFDTEGILDRCFKYDWKHIHQRKGLNDVMLWATGAEKVDDVKATLRRHYAFMSELFTYLASKSPEDPFVIQLSVYREFCTECNFVEGESRFCTAADLDVAFVNANRDAPDAACSDTINPSAALVRYEFMEVLLRIACNKYLTSEKVGMLSEALDKLMEDCIKPSAMLAACGEKFLSPKAFREGRLYSKDVDDVLTVHRELLAQIHRAFARQTVLASGADGPIKRILAVDDPVVLEFPYMSFEGWKSLLEAAQMFDGFFTIQEAAFAFCVSRMRVSNDIDIKVWTQSTHLNISDFFEALARLAELHALPSAEELEPFGSIQAFLEAGTTWKGAHFRDVYLLAQDQSLAARLKTLIGIILCRVEGFISR